MRVLLLMSILVFEAQARGAAEYLGRLQKMVDSGVITPESAEREKAHIKSSPRELALRSSVQRDLANVNPALLPLKIQRFKAYPMKLTID